MKTQNFSLTVITLVVLSLITIVSSGNAQDRQFASKGITEISGTVSYSSFTSVSNGETGAAISIFTLAPQVGYFVTDGFELFGHWSFTVTGFFCFIPRGWRKH